MWSWTAWHFGLFYSIDSVSLFPGPPNYVVSRKECNVSLTRWFQDYVNSNLICILPRINERLKQISCEICIDLSYSVIMADDSDAQ